MTVKAIELFDEQYCLEQLKQLLAIDSTTGRCEEISAYVMAELDRLGIPCYESHKGGVVAELGGEGHGLVYTAHLDDIGLMVRHINRDGTLNVCPIGGLHPFNCNGEHVRVYPFGGGCVTGTLCRIPNSIHVAEDELRKTPGDFRTNVCVVLDADVRSAADTRALGIDTGDYIALEPHLVLANGYVKSRFLDDKACAAVLLAVMKAVKEKEIPLNRRVAAFFSVFEEIGHGTSWLPAGIEDIVALDIAPTGPDQNSDEHKVSVFCKDSRFPYHHLLTDELRRAAIAEGIDYVPDVFTPHYGSDGNTSVAAGHDVRHAAMGPGTSNSHGYERIHMDALRDLFALTLAFIKA